MPAPDSFHRPTELDNLPIEFRWWDWPGVWDEIPTEKRMRVRLEPCGRNWRKLREAAIETATSEQEAGQTIEGEEG